MQREAAAIVAALVAFIGASARADTLNVEVYGTMLHSF